MSPCTAPSAVLHSRIQGLLVLGRRLQSSREMSAALSLQGSAAGPKDLPCFRSCPRPAVLTWRGTWLSLKGANAHTYPVPAGLGGRTRSASSSGRKLAAAGGRQAGGCPAGAWAHWDLCAERFPEPGDAQRITNLHGAQVGGVLGRMASIPQNGHGGCIDRSFIFLGTHPLDSRHGIQKNTVAYICTRQSMRSMGAGVAKYFMTQACLHKLRAIGALGAKGDLSARSGNIRTI